MFLPCVMCVSYLYWDKHFFYIYTSYRNPVHDGSLYNGLLDFMAPVQSVDYKAVLVFVSDDNAQHSEWLESVSPTHGHRRDALDFCNRSGCEQLVPCATHIAGNRLYFVMTDVPDIVNVGLDTPLGISDHCFVSCVFCVDHSVPE